MYIGPLGWDEYYFPIDHTPRCLIRGCRIGIGVNRSNGEESFHVAMTYPGDCWWIWIANTWELAIIKKRD